MPLPNHLKNYRVAEICYDELLASTGEPRAHWHALLERMRGDHSSVARDTVELVERLIAENGVTYNVYADPKGMDRPWTLDPLPVVLTPDEWQHIERGVAQRARLLNEVLSDLYGSQRMLSAGILPPELAFGHPNFLWPCRGITPLNNQWLSMYAVDLARAPDGKWWVLSDRTQTPSGAGYALENRQIMARIWPELLRDLHVSYLGSFFAAMREQLLSSAASDETPLAVVLTSGPFNETFFEHAYLARQLGFPLVEGSDLIVRNSTVYLKTLIGLRRVHGILRRLDDDFCDPVELRSDSALGVPGLLSAVRAGRIALANALGAGVLESPAWMGFLPGAAQWLWKEALTLPSIATWWCGERPALEYSCEHLQQLVIQGTYPNQRTGPIFGEQLDATERKELIERMQQRPHAYVAQERFSLSRVPALRGTNHGERQIEWLARAVSIRVYAVATSDGYQVMSGGLARIAGDTSVDVVSHQRGGSSKDVWVLPTTRRSPGTSTWQALPRITMRHQEVPSRVGENLFWLGRYQERCDHKLRLLRSTLNWRVDEKLWLHGRSACEREGIVITNDDISAAFDVKLDASIAADMQHLHWCATQVRARLSLDHWRAISELRRRLQRTPRTTGLLRETLDRAILMHSALSGYVADDMTQDLGWRLLMLGRRLERLQLSCALLSSQLQEASVTEQGVLEWLLEVNNSQMSFRRRFMSTPRTSLVMELLLNDAANPRSVSCQCEVIVRELLQLGEISSNAEAAEIKARLNTILEVDLGSLEGNSPGAIFARQSLSTHLYALLNATLQLADEVGLRYFSHLADDVHMVQN
jgi:uncharacterized circularly permuted ATP-grasp superfamily protein/uncharacterized alpha-E superfamily protein